MPTNVKAGEAYVEFGAKLGPLDRAFRQVSQRMTGLQSKTARLSESMGKVGGALLKAGSSLALPLTGAISAGVAFQKEISAIRGNLQGATDQEFQSLVDKAKELGSQTSFSASEVGSAMLALVKQGRDANEVLSAIGPTLDSARAGVIGIAESATLIGDTANAFGGRNFQEVADVITKTSVSASLGFEELSFALTEVGKFASSSGLSLEQVNTALGILANNSIKGSKAGTGLKNILATLVDPKKAKLITDLGVDVFDSLGNLRDPIDTLNDLGKALSSVSEEEKLGKIVEIFGKIGLGSAVTLLETTTDSIEDMRGKINSAQGEASRLSEEMSNNLGGALTSVQSALEGVSVDLTEALTPALRAFLGDVQTSLQETSAWVKENKSVVVALASVTGKLLLAGASMKALSITTAIASGAFGILAKTITFAGSTIGIINGLAIALGTVTGRAVLATKASNLLTASLLRMAIPIKGLIALGGAIVSAVGAPFAIVAGILIAGISAILYAWDDFREGFVNIFSSIGSYIDKQFGGIFSKIGDYIAKAWNAVKGFLRDVGEVLGLVEDNSDGVSEEIAKINEEIEESNKKAEEQTKKLEKQLESINSFQIEDKSFDIFPKIKIDEIEDSFKGIVATLENQARSSNIATEVEKVLQDIRERGFSESGEVSKLVKAGLIPLEQLRSAVNEYNSSQLEGSSLLNRFGRSIEQNKNRSEAQQLLGSLGEEGFVDFKALQKALKKGLISEGEIESALESFSEKEQGELEIDRGRETGTFSARTAQAMFGGGVTIEKTIEKGNGLLLRISNTLEDIYLGNGQWGTAG